MEAVLGAVATINGMGVESEVGGAHGHLHMTGHGIVVVGGQLDKTALRAAEVGYLATAL